MENLIKQIDWQKVNGLVPVITQDETTDRVLMLGFMNETALRQTMKGGKVVYYSRTKQGLWTKGGTSGNFQIVKEVYIDCDNDTLLIKAEQIGNVCHTGQNTCFFQKTPYAPKNQQQKNNQAGLA